MPHLRSGTRGYSLTQTHYMCKFYKQRNDDNDVDGGRKTDIIATFAPACVRFVHVYDY